MRRQDASRRPFQAETSRGTRLEMSNSLNLNSAELEGAPVELASQVSAKTSSLLRVLLIVVEMLVATLTTAGNSAPCSSQKILEFEIAYLHFPLHSQDSTKHGAIISW